MMMKLIQLKPTQLMMLLSLLACGTIARGQEGNSEKSEGPPKSEASAEPNNPAQSAFGGVLGENALIEYRGEGNIGTDEQGNAVVNLRGGVKITGDLLNLVCDDIVVDQAKQIMIAKGGVDFTRKEGGQKIAGTCGKLTMYMDTKKTVLEINPRVKQIGEDGSVTEMSEAEVITMTQNGDRTSITTGGGGQIRLDSGKKKEDASAQKKNAPAEKISEKSVRQIPSPSLEK